MRVPRLHAIPKLYAIVDRDTLDARGFDLRAFSEELREAGVRLLQYRDKRSAPQEVLRACAVMAEVFRDADATLVLNDRADLALLAGWGVHVGHRDLPPGAVRRVVGPGRVIGVSTHSDEQVRAAEESAADYIAIGPVFATGSKADAEPVVGLEGVRRARALTRKPLVAIGGITLENAARVLDAGADSVAVISGLLAPGRSVAEVARDFLQRMR